ncbi:RHS repeat protein [Vibrio sp. YMD68]|uniref:RHS repeat domain-containing protein n=1 Tax=Vibrio sp. YMD68 TaxID=3042300 RepID=UPI00249B46D3|nr:RHS repeat protein [Vibrio sp. YMD68]WGV98283.1 RHS repeat protein [Vibrio sp. YMD68]
MSIESNAINFVEGLSSAVDVRTGMYSIRVSLGEFFSHKNVGPNFPVFLSYSAGSSEDMGFGRGWSISLSQYDKASGKISLSTGQSFRIYKPWGGNEYEIPYRRVKDIKITYLNDSKELKVMNKEGLCEYLDESSGRLNKVVSQQGKSIYFDYDTWTGRIRRIYDKDGRKMLFDWSKERTKVDIVHKLNDTIFQSMRLKKSGNGIYRRLSSIKLNENLPPIEFSYRYIASSNYDVVETVTHSSGLIEEMVYLDNGHSLPSGAPFSTIPFIQTHTIIPSTDGSLPVTQVEYEYSDKNYLGFASEKVWIAGEDTLFKSSANYSYTTTEIVNGLKKVVRKYNKYHLQDEAKYYDDGELYRKESFEYFADLNANIEVQPAIYSLVKSQATTHYHEDQSRTFSKHYDYDDFANPIFEQDADGSKVIRRYYPSQGAKGACPAHPFGMVAFVKSETLVPNDTATTRTMTMTYRSLKRLDNSNEVFVVLSTQTDEFQSTTFDYYQNPENPLTYGQVRRQKNMFNGYEIKTDVEYQFLNDGLKTTTSFTSHDNLTVTESATVDYFWGQAIELVDEEGVVSQFSYDSLGRKVAAVTAPDTDFEVIQTYSYSVGDGVNSTKQVDAKGNTVEKRFDNAGKLLEVVQGQPGKVPKVVVSCKYDHFGMMTLKTETDWLDGIALPLTTVYQYDINGDVSQVTHPDGRLELITQNPVRLTTRYEHQSGQGERPLMVENTTFDISGRELNKQTYDADGSLIASTDYRYDGYGNLLSVTDTEGRVIDYRYDNIDRLVEVTRTIDGQSICESYTYPEFTTADIPCQVFVNNVLQGQQEFDGLMRLKHQTSLNSGTVDYSYSGTSSMAKSINTASGDQVNFSNNKYLRVPTTISVEGESQLGSAHTYDTKSALPLSNQNYSGKRGVTRDSQGRVLTETVDIDGMERQASFRYSQQGKLLEKSDFFGNTSTYHFDNLGRLARSEEVFLDTSTVTTFEYDAFSRPYKYTTLRGEDKAEVELEFNGFGMEIWRKATFNKSVVFSIEQVFNPRMLLDSRTFTQGSDSTHETFFYDDLARLERYKVTGPNAPVDDYGNTIRKQRFVHDVFGNITKARSVFDDGTSNVAGFYYATLNPQRLESLTNTHVSYPSSVSFSYDAAGNLLNDEQGRSFNYNALNQMTSVEEDGDVLSQYRYDAGGRVVAQSVEENLIHLFYLNGQLVNEKSGATHSSFHNIASGLSSRSVSSPDEEIHQFSLGNSQDSVLETFTSTDGQSREKTSRKYTPYGEG